MNILKADITQIRQLHKNSLSRDFPKNELRPFHMMKTLTEKNQYIVYLGYQNHTLIGYACFLTIPQNSTTLMDYFAIEPQFRHQGNGSIFFKDIVKKYFTDFPSTNTIVIECENSEKTTDNSEKIIRQKRIDFYVKNGAVISNCGWHAFGVDYLLLTVTKNDLEIISENLGQTIYNLYMNSADRLFQRIMKKNIYFYLLK